MDPAAKKPPRGKNNRIVLHFDYDCFYASVFESKEPELKTKPLGVKQKGILATCNYVARARGVKKLMQISEAYKICPDLLLRDGEDLTPFRDMSKVLWGFLRSFSWSNKVERLGFDEVFMDVTTMIDYNYDCINRFSLSNTFFCLSAQDPENGFMCDLSAPAGCVYGPVGDGALERQDYLRLVLASHLAHYLRTRIEQDFGYTCTCGVSTNKLLSKLAGSQNKPRNQTTLLALEPEDAVAFMDEHTLRSIPGVGFKLCHLIESHVERARTGEEDAEPVKAGQVRCHPGISAPLLESILGGPGSERGIGMKVWKLLHGVDDTEVKEAADIPSQISIEDTYRGLEGTPQITAELEKLCASLIRRMRVDLVIADDKSSGAGGQRWIARPKTLRLSTNSAGSSTPREVDSGWSRISRSQPLPAFVFDLDETTAALAQRLVAEAALPLLRRLRPDKEVKWELRVLNICVTGMEATAGGGKDGVGRDIGVMFRTQDENLRPWRVTEGGDVAAAENGATASEDRSDGAAAVVLSGGSQADVDGSDEEAWHGQEDDWDNESRPCLLCGWDVPAFAVSAHERYHAMELEEE